MAETYHIYDYKALQPMLAAVLCVGLRENSRVKMALKGAKMTTESLLMAYMADSLAFLAWSKTKDAFAGRNRPKSFVHLILDNGKKETKDVETFADGREFEAEIERLLGELKNG